MHMSVYMCDSHVLILFADAQLFHLQQRKEQQATEATHPSGDGEDADDLSRVCRV